MQYPSDSAPWRLNFIGTLQLLGQAAARQPFGVPDPVLCGAAAVELYTGGLWSSGCPEVSTTDARSLIVELFAVGFRWTSRPQRAGRGLWHPGLQAGINVINHTPRELTELSNVLTVALDLGVAGPADRNLFSLKVVGIEDLIVEEVVCMGSHGLPSGEAAARARVLAGLGREGVGGRFRPWYLDRRLAWETGGEVTLDALLSDGAGEGGAAPRMITLSGMRTLINDWRIKGGFSFDRARPVLQRGRRETGAHRMRNRNDQRGGEGGQCAAAANVIPLDATQPNTP